jgi:hypothetical protein
MTTNPMEQPWHGAASVQERRVTVATRNFNKGGGGKWSCSYFTEIYP